MMMRCVTQILPLLLFVLTIYSNFVLADIDDDMKPNNTISCYRCNNGYKANPSCVNAPHEDSKITVVKSDEECMSLAEFFSKYNMVTNEWSKRALKGKGKGRGRTSTEELVFAYCATVVVYATNHEAIPQVYRDCVKGTEDEVKRNFQNTFEYDVGEGQEGFTMPTAAEGETEKCNRKNPGSDRGTKIINVCLCLEDKCNKKKASSGWGSSGPKLSMLLIWFLFSTPIITLLRYM